MFLPAALRRTIPAANGRRSIITAMGDLLKLIWYAVAGLFRSRTALQTEVSRFSASAQCAEA
jgi:hypothetical protein